MIYTLTLNPALDKEYQVSTLELDHVMRTDQVGTDFGGKGFNVSRMLSALGVASMALGFVGGHTGDVLLQGLRSLGIKTEPTIIAGETRINISIIGESDGHYVKVNEIGPVVSKDEVQALLRKIDPLLRPGDFWVLSGSLPNNVPKDIYAKIICRVNQCGAYAVLDASGKPFKVGVKEKPFLIKPNIHELSDLVSREITGMRDLVDVTSTLHAEGLKNVLVSLGEKGAFLSASGRQWYAQSPKIQVRNPTGAGDAMIAGFIWRLSEGDTLEAALPWATACGTAAASLMGTGMPSIQQIEAFYEKIAINPL